MERLDTTAPAESPLATYDSEVAAAIDEEKKRQEEKMELIASENVVSKAVLEAQGSILTNKYAEGYPGARFYGGCTNVDKVEDLARRRALKLFKAGHVNVQPHAGAPANLAVFFATLKAGDKILGMELSHGGHLTHGCAANISGKYYNVSSYGVSPEDGFIHMEEVRKIALEQKPRLIIAGASAYPRIIDFAAFAAIAEEVGAYLMVDMAHIAGLVVGGVHPSPVEHADFVTTTTHKTLRGPRGGLIICKEKYADIIDRAVFPGIQGGPLMHIIAAKAVAFKEAMEPDFKIYQQKVAANAKTLAAAMQEYDFDLITGGTDNHLMLIDLDRKGLTGIEAEVLLDNLGITANKNAVPFDKKPRHITSGLRLGTPSITSRGMGAEQMVQIADIINEAISNPKNTEILNKLGRRVKEICYNFPVE